MHVHYSMCNGSGRGEARRRRDVQGARALPSIVKSRRQWCDGNGAVRPRRLHSRLTTATATTTWALQAQAQAQYLITGGLHRSSQDTYTYVCAVTTRTLAAAQTSRCSTSCAPPPQESSTLGLDVCVWSAEQQRCRRARYPFADEAAQGQTRDAVAPWRHGHDGHCRRRNSRSRSCDKASHHAAHGHGHRHRHQRLRTTTRLPGRLSSMAARPGTTPRARRHCMTAQAGLAQKSLPASTFSGGKHGLALRGSWHMGPGCDIVRHGSNFQPLGYRPLRATTASFGWP